jgi:DNA invertase Pin-like site-specific DNA recombinase
MENLRRIEVIKPTKTIADTTLNVVTKKRVGAYARVSTDYEDQINSYRNQIVEYTNMINNNPNYSLVKIYADEGLSGTQAKKRPEFMKMIEDARSGLLDLIITKSISRFGRNTVDVITYIRELKSLGVIVFFEKENLYSDDSKMEFMLTILASISQEESRSISTNTKWSLEKKCQRGEVSARRMYGYDVVDKNYVINAEESRVVKNIFYLYSQGFNMNDIAKTLNRDGIKTLNGGEWRQNTINSILTNEKYIGDCLLQKTVCVDYLTHKTIKNEGIAPQYYIHNNHEPIIDKEIFKNVQAIIASKISHKGKVSRYPLGGILYCPHCGRTLKRHTVNYNNPSQHTVLNCNHSYKNDAICSSRSAKYDLVMEVVNDAIKQICNNKSIIDTLKCVFSNNIGVSDLKEEISIIELDNKKLSSLIKESTREAEVDELKLKLSANNNSISEIKKVIAHKLTTSVRLEYINSIINRKDFTNNEYLYKSIFNMVLADDMLITLVISPTKDIKTLCNEINEINNTPSIFKTMYIDSKDKNCINYEVKFNE